MKKTAIMLLLFMFSAAFAVQIGTRKKLPLPDGFVLDGLDGLVSTESGKWFFAPFEPASAGWATLEAGTKVQILPSSTLEKFESAIAQSQNRTFRLWGKFTTYDGKNYIYLSYYLPVAEPNIPKQEEIEVEDANVESLIPEDALALLRPQRKINLAELKIPLAAEADGVLVDRTGFLRQENDEFYFDFDALGRNIDPLSLPLLGGEVLDYMAAARKLSPYPTRFKISAIATGYKGRNYLLIQRATIAYGDGNFNR